MKLVAAFRSLSVCLTFFLFLTHFNVAAVSASDRAWQFNEGNDSGNKGRATASLMYGVPETDDVQVSGTCDATPGTGVVYSSVIFGAETGDLQDGASVTLRFSGGGFSRDVEGKIYGKTAEVGVSGVVLDLKHDDPLWDGLTTKSSLDYLVPGYRASTLELSAGRGKIKSFIRTCRDYERLVSKRSGGNGGSDTSSSADSGSSDDSVSEKEAFESAKELNTIEAWEAFLNNFPKGFRADLARAYVKRLGQETPSKSTTPSSAPKTPAVKTATPVVTPSRPLSMLDLGQGGSRWVNGYRRFALSNNQSFYTASVRARGVELITFCMDNQMSGGFGYQLGAVIRQNRPGSYPKFDQRVAQGLGNSSYLPSGQFKRIGISFSNGDTVIGGAASPTAQNGEVAIGSTVLGFGVNSGHLESMMAAGSMSVSFPPFGATFQLTGSRKAICDVMKRCGARPPGCGGGTFTRPSTDTSCTKGRVFSKRAGKCVCPRGKVFRKGRCRTVVKKCKRGFELVNGRCLRNDELNNPNGFCGPGYRMVNGKCIHQNQLKPKKCPKGFERVNGRCLRNDELNNPNDLCGPGYRMVKGKCVHQNSLNKKPANSGGCIGGQIRLANGNCVCPQGFQYINKQCVNMKQLQQNLKQIFSDIRLKTAVRQVGRLDNGVRLYSFRYRGQDETFVGVMAQDLLKRPALRQAVHMTSTGFYAVDYEALGLKLASYSAWERSGIDAVIRSSYRR